MFRFQRVCASIAWRGAACGCALAFAGPASAQCVDAWGSLGDLNGNVEALIMFDGELIVGGAFTETGGVSANRIARWDGSRWAPMGAGFNAEVRALGIYRGEIVAGGAFTATGDGETPVNHIARWNGYEWAALGGGVDGLVADWSGITVYDEQLIVGGSFTSVPDLPGVVVNNIARWDGQWSAMGSGFTGGAHLNALRSFRGRLYAAGWFLNADGVAASMAAKWDGEAETWSALSPNSVNNSATILGTFEDRLLFGNDFTSPGMHIAGWDGSAWSTFGTGMNSSTFASTVHRGDLIVGGLFTEADGVPANYIARWDGTGWHPLGDGTNLGVRAMTVYKDELIVGGYFTSAGGIPAGHIARWGAGPSFVSQPTDWADRCLGDDVQFSATVADGSAAYQWYKDGTPMTDDARISGSQTNTLRIDGITRDDAGLYSATAGTVCGTSLSRSALLAFQPTIPGDVDDDGDVDLTDLSMLLAHFGTRCM